eukprot:366695_1
MLKNMYQHETRLIHKLCRNFSTARPAIQNISTHVENNTDYLKINWSDGLQSSYPSIYLRDNCLNTKTENGQRIFETHELDDFQFKINDYSIDKITEKLNIKWNDQLTQHFDADWLFNNSCNTIHRKQRTQQLNNKITHWDNTFHLNVTCNYSEIKKQHIQIEIYKQLREFGVCLINNGPAKEIYDTNNDPPVINVGNTLGYVRQTNYGKYFNVMTMPKTDKDCNHLAYTSAGLSGHTDNPYRNPTPGIQLLHCIKQSSGINNGNTQLIDGFRIVDELRNKYTKEFELLSTIKRPFTYYDSKIGHLFHKQRAVINIDENDDVESIYFNNRSASCVNWNIEENIIEPYYKAWKLFGDLMQKYCVEFKLEPGQIVIFNNNRILHGRNKYVDDNSGDCKRLLQGCYIDCDTVWARLDGYEYLNHKQSLQNDI